MCNPTAILMAVQTAAEISATNKAAERGQDAIVEQQKQMNMQRAMQMEEENRKTANKLTEQRRKTLAEQSSIVVATAESGGGGATPLRNLAYAYMQGAIDSGTIISENEASIVQVAMESQSDFVKARGKIGELESKKKTGFDAALAIGTSAAVGYGAGGGFETGATVGGQWKKTTDLFTFT